MNFIEVASIISKKGVPLRFFALKKATNLPWNVESSYRRVMHNNAELSFDTESITKKVGRTLDKKFIRKRFNMTAYVPYLLILLLLDEQDDFVTSCAAFELMFPKFNFEPAVGAQFKNLRMGDVAFQTIASKESLKILWAKAKGVNFADYASVIERNHLNILFKALGTHDFQPLVAKLLRKYTRRKNAVETAKGSFLQSH